MSVISSSTRKPEAFLRTANLARYCLCQRATGFFCHGWLFILLFAFNAT
jgi:hypothetical protein